MVNFFSNRIKLNKKRGISTIIGGIIFLILLTAGFSAFFLAMEVQSDTIDAQRTISDSIIDKTQEKFSMAAITDDSNGHKLEIQVTNEGRNSLEISDIWIINKSEAPSYPALKIPVNYSDAFIPAGFNASILANQHLTMIPNDYDIKVISVLGSIQKSELRVGGNNYLLAEMFTIPPDVRHNENVTVALRITNVGPTMISGIAPDFNPPQNDNPLWVGSSQLVSTIPVDLEPSESTIFSWHTTLNDAGSPGSKLEFTDSASGTESLTGLSVSSNTASDKLTVRDPKGGSGDTIIVNDELFARPRIFMVIPSPFGDAGDKGVWGINVANPTNRDMYVSKVLITLISPRDSDDSIGQDEDADRMINSDSCSPQAISTISGNWRCVTDNQLWWEDLDNPVKIDPKSVYPFLAKIEPGHLYASGKHLDSIVVQGSVFTDMGSFGKSGYMSSMIFDYGSNDPIANVYLVEPFTATQTELTDKNWIESTVPNVLSGQPWTFNAVLANLDSTGGSRIVEDDTKFIINLHEDWTFIGFGPGTAGFNPLITVDPGDGSTQIIGTLDDDLTGVDPNIARVIQFDATAPTVSDTKMYLMHMLATGKTDQPFAVGPIAEIVVQVVP